MHHIWHLYPPKSLNDYTFSIIGIAQSYLPFMMSKHFMSV